MDIQADLSVCTVVFKHPHAFRSFLSSLSTTAPPVSLEVVVVDRTGQVANCLAKEFSDLIIYEDPLETNPVRALNRGLSLATGRYLSVWDNNVTVREECLLNLLSFLDQNPDVALAGPMVLDAHGRPEPSPQKFPSLAATSSPLSPFRRLLNHADTASSPLSSEHRLESRKVDWLQSGCHIIRREAFDEIGFFDSAFSWPYAEMDYYYRTQRASWHNYFCPKASIIHANTSRYHPQFREPGSFSRFPQDALRHLRKKWFFSKNIFQEPGF